MADAGDGDDNAIPAAVSMSTSSMSDTDDDGDDDGVIPAASWSSLPWDLLAQILSRLTFSVHYLRVVHACKQWADTPLPSACHLPLQPPVALFTEFSSRGPYYNPITGISHQFPGPPLDSYCFGTSHGWLLFLGSNSSVYTFNPVTYECVGLPHLFTAPANMLQFHAGTYPDYRVFPNPSGDQVVPDTLSVMVRRRDLIRLSVLSSDPAEDQNFVMLIILNHIANKYLYCRKGGDPAWAPITVPLADFRCSDLAPTRSKKIYAIDSKKMAMLTFDLSDPAKNINVSSYTISGVPRPPSPDATFLVESADGSLLLVNKILEVHSTPYNAVLVVFRLDLSAPPPQARAVAVADIGAGNALFVSEGASGCVNVSAFPCTFWPNHVYFFRPYHGYEAGQAFEAETMGIFSLEKGKLAADSRTIPRGWPYPLRGKVRWLFFNLRFRDYIGMA